MKKLALFVLILFSFLTLEAELYSETISAGTRDFLSIRVEFQEDNTLYTTGNGKFMLTEWTEHDTDYYALDPLPHDRAYFSAHLEFLDNYWNKASNGNVRINADDSYQLPLADSSFTLSQPMRYYSTPDSLDTRLARLIYESVMLANESGQYRSDQDAIIIYHAGAGQDFKISLDNSPFDIPSFYFDESYLEEFLPSEKYDRLMALNCRQGIVLPESQNQMGISIALNGTEVLLTGMLLGLPTLYDIELGRSGAGVYGLMDQGSNTGSGLCPIKPSAFERYLLGASQIITASTSGNYTLKQDDIYRIPISSNEYFLIEYRENTGMWADSIMWNDSTITNWLELLHVMDSLNLVDYTLTNGVLTDYSDLDIGLPHSGLLIWHVNESELGVENPNDWASPFIDLVEADGGSDIGKFYGALNSSVNNGWKWDTWFKNNEAFRLNNPSQYKIRWNNNTHPNTRSFENINTGIAINDFNFQGDSLVIELVIDAYADFLLPNIVFDEMTSSLPADITEDKLLLGYSDSSIVLFNNGELREIFQSDTKLKKGNTALISYNNDILLVTNTDSNAVVSQLSYLASSLQEENTISLPNPVDLERITLAANTLFLPPRIPYTYKEGDPYPTNKNIYKLDILAWNLTDIGAASLRVVPYVIDNDISFDRCTELVIGNNKKYFADGYVLRRNTIPDSVQQRYFYPLENTRITSLVPIHLDNNNEFDIVALWEAENNNALLAFNDAGAMLNNFPIVGNYSKLRVYEVNDSKRFVAYDPKGLIDIFNEKAEKILSFTAPVKATTLFLEQVTDDSAYCVLDGSVYSLESDSIYWGYKGMDAHHTNNINSIKAIESVQSDLLINNGLIYNYPNPIKGLKTNFRFFATGASDVKIDIFTLSGIPVHSIQRSVSDQQWNDIPWFIDDNTSGVYIAKITFSGEDREEIYYVKPAILK